MSDCPPQVQLCRTRGQQNIRVNTLRQRKQQRLQRIIFPRPAERAFCFSSPARSVGEETSEKHLTQSPDLRSRLPRLCALWLFVVGRAGKTFLGLTQALMFFRISGKIAALVALQIAVFGRVVVLAHAMT